MNGFDAKETKEEMALTDEIGQGNGVKKAVYDEGTTKPKHLLPGGGFMCVDGNYAVAHVSYRVNDVAVSPFR